MDRDRLLVGSLAAAVLCGAVGLWAVNRAQDRPAGRPVAGARAVVAPVAPPPGAGAAAGEDGPATPEDVAQPAALRSAAEGWDAGDAGLRLDARGVPIRTVRRPARARAGRDLREPTVSVAPFEAVEEPGGSEEAVALRGGLAGYDDEDGPAVRAGADDEMDEQDDDGDDGPDPDVRAALARVGADPAAERAWAEAVNDPDRPAAERSALIGGLDDAGFDDPQNPSPDDLPLIERRLALIEFLSPDPLDESNAAALAEAYERLLAMHARASGGAGR